MLALLLRSNQDVTFLLRLTDHLNHPIVGVLCLFAFVLLWVFIKHPELMVDYAQSRKYGFPRTFGLLVFAVLGSALGMAFLCG